MSALNLKKLTAIIASSFCLWNIDITSANAVQLTFYNTTNKIATNFHIKFKWRDDIFSETQNADTGFGPIENGDSYTYIFPENAQGFISAEWSFAEGENEPVSPGLLVPEPTTIFGSALALGVGGWMKRKKSSQQNKIKSHH